MPNTARYKLSVQLVIILVPLLITLTFAYLAFSGLFTEGWSDFLKIMTGMWVMILIICLLIVFLNMLLPDEEYLIPTKQFGSDD